MGLGKFLSKIFGHAEGQSPSEYQGQAEAQGQKANRGPAQSLGVEELARRLGLAEDQLRACQPAYSSFTIPKRSGGTRQLATRN